MKKLILGYLAVSLCTMSWSQTFTNPLNLEGEDLDGLADPCVVKYLGKYYLYTTWGVGSGGMRVWESDNLVDWEYKGKVFSETPPDNYFQHSWAPDVFYYNGTFYHYSSGPKSDGLSGPAVHHKILSASHPLGPFTAVNPQWHEADSIDGQVFMDDDGQIYFSFAATGGIRWQTMSDPVTLSGSNNQLSNCVVEVENDPESTWTEGPQIFKVNGTYYLHYCGNDYRSAHGAYQVHVAKGNSVANLSPQINNPILLYTAGDYWNLGHNYVVLGPDLHTHYTIYHAMQRGSTYRKLMVDKLFFAPEHGDCAVFGPNFSSQPKPALPDWVEAFDRPTLGPDWSNEAGGSWNLNEPGQLSGNNLGDYQWSRQISRQFSGEDYVAEFNIKLVTAGATSLYPKMGVLTSYSDFDNCVSVWIDPQYNLIASNAREGGTDLGWVNSAELPAFWDHTKWHTLRVVKSGSTLQVFYDNMLKLTRDVGGIGGGKVGLVLEDCHALYGWSAFTSTVGGLKSSTIQMR